MKKIGLMILGVVLVLSFAFVLTDEPNEPLVEDPATIVDVKEDTPLKVDVFANQSDAYGVETTSTFTLKFNNAVDMSSVRDNIALDPPTSFELTELSDSEYLLAPSEELTANLIYNINYDALAYGKAFQVADDLRIYASYPGKDAYDVPVRSGIELLFNVDNVTEINEYFSITPHVDGEFAYNEKSVVFMPESLDPGIVYTVTVAPGLVVGQREMLEEHSFSFTTGYGSDFNWNTSYSVMNVRPNTAPIVGINTWNDNDQYHLALYKVNNFDDYLDTYETFLKNQTTIDETEYELILSSDMTTLYHNYRSYIELPELEKGRYIAKIVGENVEQYVFIQSDVHQIYYSKAINGEMFWILNGDNNKPQEGAQIKTEEEILATSDRQGIVFIPTNEDDVLKNYVVAVEGVEYIVNSKPSYVVYYNGYYYNTSSDEYWSFVYTDRNVYQQDDIIHVFGFIKSFTDDIPKNLNIKIKRYWGEDDLIVQAFDLSDDYTVTADIELVDFEYGYYDLLLFSGETLISSREFSVLNYEKPEIKMTSSIDKSIVFSGETINYQLSASYFNELPYEGMSVNIYQNELAGVDIQNVYKTDDKGEINLSILTSNNDEYWQPDYYSIEAFNDSVESTYLSSWASLYILSRDQMITSTYDIEDNLASISVATNMIDISNYNGSFGNDYEAIKGEVIDQSIRVDIVDHYYEKIYLRTEYNPIHKVSYDVYDYQRRESIVEPFEIQTVNGMANYDFVTEEDHYYDVTYTMMDNQNRSVKSSQTIGGYFYKWFNFDTEYTMPYSNETYDVGDFVEKEVLSYGESIESNENDYALHLFLRSGILDYVVTENPKITFEFIESYKPNIYLKTIYYDGNTLSIVPEYESHLIGYDYLSVEGDIEAVTDRKDYKPGEKVSVDIMITKANGEAFNGKVNVSIVDEAYFALFMDHFDLGPNLHAYVYDDGIVHESVSNEKEAMMDGAEAGEGGDDNYVRDDFRDTAYFETVEVINGKAALTFDLPDNLSSWRLTLNAVDKNLNYASTKLNVNVSLPYFVRVLYNTTYLTGDEVFIALKSDGKALEEGDQITYTADLMFEGAKVTSSQIETNTKGITNLSIGTLDRDQYELVVKGTVKDYLDGIKEKIVVKDTVLEFNHRQSKVLKKNHQLMNNADKTILYVYNKKARDYVDALYSAFTNDRFRIEEIIARFGAFELLEEHFTEYEYDYYDVDEFQDYSGGIKLLPTSDPDVHTTAMIAATDYGMKYFDAPQLIQYLKEQLTSEIPLKEKALILWALSAQKEAMLLAVDEYLLLNPFEDLEHESQLYILLALKEMGDKSRVFDLSSQLFESYDQNQFSQQSQILFATLAMRIGLNLEAFEDMMTKTFETKESISLERVYYFKHKEVDFKGASVVVEVGGIETTYALPGLSFETIKIDAEESFEVRVINDDVYVMEVYQVTGLDYETYENANIHIEKSYPTDIKQGDVIEVNIAYNKPEESFVTLRDTIPAGFEFAGTDRGQLNYSINQQNQDIKISLYSEESSSGSVKYYLKAVQKGKYHVDPTAAQNYFEEWLYMTKPMVVEVQ